MISNHARFTSALVLLIIATRLGAQVPESRATKPPMAENITFELFAPESRPTESRGTPPVAVIRVTNKNAAAVTLWPFVALQIRDAKGNEQKPSSNRGRFGRRRQACFLEAIDFATLEPGKSIDWPVKLDLYTHDPAAMLGWKLAPGEYTLTARYAFSRADFVARCRSGCPGHAEAQRPWNVALELEREASLKVTIE